MRIVAAVRFPYREDNTVRIESQYLFIEFQ